MHSKMLTMNIFPPTDIEKILRREVAYADDVDFISSLEFVRTQEMRKSSQNHKLFVNVEKKKKPTDFTKLSRNQKN